MTKYRVRVTKQAQGHLTEIRRYIEWELLAPDSALRIIRALRNEMQSLSEMPYRYQPIDEEPWHSEGIRKTQVNNYYIYYWINEEAKMVQVFGVIYVRRDQERQLQLMNKK